MRILQSSKQLGPTDNHSFISLHILEGELAGHGCLHRRHDVTDSHQDNTVLAVQRYSTNEPSPILGVVSGEEAKSMKCHNNIIINFAL